MMVVHQRGLVTKHGQQRQGQMDKYVSKEMPVESFLFGRETQWNTYEVVTPQIESCVCDEMMPTSHVNLVYVGYGTPTAVHDSKSQRLIEFIILQKMDTDGLGLHPGET